MDLLLKRIPREHPVYIATTNLFVMSIDISYMPLNPALVEKKCMVNPFLKAPFTLRENE